ncbi:MAG: DUF3786 domain-containing protein [Nitrospirae bacterium]|nr:DUF3786 domain-containing protein [Nitrospirota bacterium]
MTGPLEIYRKLPKTNCGRCPQKSCIAFSAAFLRGEAVLDDCPFLTEETRNRLSRIRPKDWRTELVERLKEEVKRLDLRKIAPSIGAETAGDTIRITCLGNDYFIDEDGEIKTSGHINPYIKILLLHYIRTAGRGRPTGKWVSFSELKSGMIKEQSFKRDCEEPLKELFEKDPVFVETLLLRMGAERIEFESADYAYLFNPLPRIPTLILYRKGEAGSLKILFDRITDSFLDVESIIFLMEGIIHILSNALSHRGR